MPMSVVGQLMLSNLSHTKQTLLCASSWIFYRHYVHSKAETVSEAVLRFERIAVPFFCTLEENIALRDRVIYNYAASFWSHVRY